MQQINKTNANQTNMEMLVLEINLAKVKKDHKSKRVWGAGKRALPYMAD